MRRSWVAGVALATFVSSSIPSAWAQAPAEAPAAPARPPTSAELSVAKKHYADGEKKYKAGDFAGALADFLAANEVKSTPHAERYIGLCQDALGHPVEAVDWYTKFLTHVPDKLAAQGDEARKRVAEIQAMPGKVHVDSSPPGADVTVDGKPQAGPTPLDVELSPGTHSLAFSEKGRLPVEKNVEVTFASAQSVNVDLEAEPPPPPPVAVTPPPPPAAPPTVPPPEPQPRSKVPAYVTGALALAAAGVGTAFGVLALNDKASFDRNPTTATADSGDTHALVADMSFGIAVTFAVTSIVLFVTKDEAPAATSRGAAVSGTAEASPSKAERVSWSAAPLVGPHTGGAGLLVQF